MTATMTASPEQRTPPLRREEQLDVVHLGRIDFQEAWRAQQRFAEARRAGRCGNTLLLADHPPTLCTGVLGQDEHVLITSSQRHALGLPYYRVDRGGDVMYVGPGHLVAYPIVSLPSLDLDPIGYLRLLEQVLIDALADFGIEAHRIRGLTGVWVGEDKIAGVAVKVARGVTTHGFNLNVSPDLAMYRHIVTCGNHGRGVTSMERLLGRRIGPEEVEAAVIAQARPALAVSAGGAGPYSVGTSEAWSGPGRRQALLERTEEEEA